jgi:hypothetical protein
MLSDTVQVLTTNRLFCNKCIYSLIILQPKKVGSVLTEAENWDLLVDCTSRDGRQMLDAGVHVFTVS